MSLHQSGQWRCNKGWNQWIQQQTANHSSVCCITELWFFSPFSRCIRTKQWNAIQITHFHQTGTFPTPLLTGQWGDNVGVYQQYYCSIYIKKKQELGLPDNHQGLIIYVWWIQRKNYSQCSCTIKATPFWHHSTPNCTDCLQLPRMSNPQIICGVLKGYPWNPQRVSADLFKGISAVRIIRGICGIAWNDNRGIVVLYS